MKYSVTRPTPRNMRYALCQRCSFKFHVKDLIKVTDKNNRDYGLLLCKRDYASSKPNPQDRPKIVQEKLLAYTNKVNPQSEDTQYITNPLDDRAPGKPLEGYTVSDPLDGKITLKWSAPFDQGSSPIKYYVILSSEPQRLNYVTLTNNSGTNVPYYKDTTHNPSSYVSYKVAAVNGYGQGEFSDEFYWPIDLYDDSLLHGVNYILTGDFNYIATGDGSAIVYSGL